MKEIREMAGVGKETVRTALYGAGVSPRSARAIAAVLGSSEREVRAVETELRQPPRSKV
jgi:hypothetical protein